MHNTLKILKRCKYPDTTHAYPTYPTLDISKTRAEQAERFIAALNTYREKHAQVDNIAPLLTVILRDATHDEILQDIAYGNDKNPLQTTHRRAASQATNI